MPSRVPDDRRDVDVARPQRPVHALADGLGVGQLAALHTPGEAVVDVLHVRVRDPVGRLAGQLRRVGAADQQVPGVEAQRDARAVEYPLHVVRVLDHGPDVRVQHGL